MKSVSSFCATALTSLTLAGSITSAMAQAASEAEPASALSNISFSANVSVVSQYRYRGIMQTNNKPAIRGRLDLTHASGVYLGSKMQHKLAG